MFHGNRHLVQRGADELIEPWALAEDLPNFLVVQVTDHLGEGQAARAKDTQRSLNPSHTVNRLVPAQRTRSRSDFATLA